jgi:pimeloyl-ACP methyl ester carboxylesterase
MERIKRLVGLASFAVITVMTSFGGLVLSACGSDDSFEVAPTEVTKVSEEVREGYTFVRYMAKQPAFRDRASDEYVTQRVYVGIPDGVAMDAPVIFVLGQESPIGENLVAIAPEFTGMPVIAVNAEHRGYGESLSSAEDQTVPSYVSAREAVEDFHEVAKALQETYTGPWVVDGVSYVGGVVLQYGAKYPDDVVGVHSLSGVVDLPVANTAYDAFTRERLGEEAYAAGVNHMKDLEPVELFDSNWIDREFLEGIVGGITQYDNYQPLVPTIRNMMTTLTTEQLIADLRDLDQVAANGDAASYGADRALSSLSREEALQVQPSWRTYFWQQCTDIGTFFASDGDGIYSRGEEDWDAECQAMFGVGLVREHAGHRQDVTAMEEAGVPLVFASGGKDPWSGVGLEVPPESDLIDQQERWSEYQTSYGLHFHSPEGFHCPPCSDLELSQLTWQASFELAGIETGTATLAD